MPSELFYWQVRYLDIYLFCVYILPSVLWHCLLGIRKNIRPVKNWVMRCWCGYLSGMMCRLFGCGPADATASQTPSSFESRLVLPFWYWLARVVPENRPLNGCSVVCLRWWLSEFPVSASMCRCMHVSLCACVDRASFLGISVVGQSNSAGDGGIYVGSIMKGSVVFHLLYELSLLLSWWISHELEHLFVLYVGIVVSCSGLSRCHRPPSWIFLYKLKDRLKIYDLTGKKR